MKHCIPSLHIYNTWTTQGQGLAALHEASQSEDVLFQGDFVLVEGSFTPENYHHLGDECVVHWLNAHNLSRRDASGADRSSIYARGVLFVPERPDKPWVVFDAKLLRQHCCLIHRIDPLWYETETGWYANTFFGQCENPWSRIFCSNQESVWVSTERALVGIDIEEEKALHKIPEDFEEHHFDWKQKAAFRANRFSQEFGVDQLHVPPRGVKNRKLSLITSL